jgi:hypothetical protein
MFRVTMSKKLVLSSLERTVKPAAMALALTLAIGLAGCATGESAANTTATSSAPVMVLPSLPSLGLTAPGRPVDVYVKLARLAKACWLSDPAPLQQGYLFTADANPEARGGAVSIVIYEKNASLGIKGDRGLVAYSISLTPSGDTATSISVENGRIADGFAKKMQADVERWAAGETDCNVASAWPTAAAKGDAIEPGQAAKVLKAAVSKKK